MLARTQTEWALARLRAAHPEIEFELCIIQTTGDLKRDVPYAAVGTKGMFVKEIEQALFENRIDIGVHSLKDMPGELPEGLELACVPAREDPGDALISRQGLALQDLPLGATVGTSSARRQALLAAYRNDLNLVELRGNLDTRLQKLDSGAYDAIVLACAGLNRLGLAHRITERISFDICLPAVGQGALALESRVGDTATLNCLQAIHDPDTACCVDAERALLAALGGGCSVPIAGHAVLAEDAVHLTALIASQDGLTILRVETAGSREEAHALGIEAAHKLYQQGGQALMKGD